MAPKPNEPVASVSPPHVPVITAQKKDFHILVVEDNPINQQIALKTIRNLGFSVSAVWNGKEALDYLLKAAETAQSANPANPLALTTTPADSIPLPNLILMDVQMPTLDGYQATHAIRYHAPFKNIELIQKIPIVAMTASAIQGDREKCKRAGMDDYLAKPVRRPVLEKMISKWVEGAAQMTPRTQPELPSSTNKFSERPEMARCGTSASSNCPGVEYLSPRGQDNSVHSPSVPLSPAPRSEKHAQFPHITSSMSQEKIRSLRGAGDPHTALSEGDRGLRRVEAEEQAANLRDEKLLAATETEPHNREGVGGAGGAAGGGRRAGGLGSSSPLLVSFIPSTGLPFSAGPPPGGGGESYSEQRAHSGNVMALTEANVERFNADKADDAGGEAALPMRTGGGGSTGFDGAEDSRTPSSAASMKAISGNASADVSSDLLLSPWVDRDVEMTRVEKTDPMDYSLKTTQQEGHGQGQQPGKTRDQHVKAKTRQNRLSTQDRMPSDWSQTTAKP